MGRMAIDDCDSTSSSETADDVLEEKAVNGEDATISANEVGMSPETKTLYRNNRKSPWEEWAPDSIGIDHEKQAESKRYALVVRREVRNGDSEQPVLALHSISVQSPLLKSALEPVFAGYPGIRTNLEDLEFRTPFLSFFHRWERFRNAANNQTDDLTQKHMLLLYDILSSEIQPKIDRTKDLLLNQVISFDYLWAIFEPGATVYSRVDDVDRLYLLKGSRYETIGNATSFVLSCRYIDTDGSSFGYASRTLEISEFSDLSAISELLALPSNLHSSISGITKQLTARGKRFEELKGFHYVEYSGMFTPTHEDRMTPSAKQYLENNRIIIDCTSFDRYSSESPPRLESLNSESADIGGSKQMVSFASLLREDDNDASNTYSSQLSVIMHPVYVERREREQKRRGEAAAATRLRGEKVLDSRQHLLCTPMLRGYDLVSKQWGRFHVDNVREIVWRDKAFDQPVLQQDYKRIVWAFVRTQLSSADGFDDVIGGKGKGTIMLLCGEPGVGKTLTAESVSEAMKRPLYSLSAGELGDTADQVEKSLRKVLEISTRWSAVLLLDECDIFLEKRSSTTLERNKLVSVFLRLLEYYKGVMFLTSNRPESFDPAFESRIHLTIHYPKLDYDSRLKIWQTFVPTVDKHDASVRGVCQDDLVRLAGHELNGRHIKNVVKTARLLAAQEGSPLLVEHIKTVLRVKSGNPVSVTGPL